MITTLKGKVIDKNDSILVLEVAGIGYKIQAPIEVIEEAKIGEEFFLWTHMAVRETSMELFGFENKDDMEFFEDLLEVPGIGPRSAVGIFNLAPRETLQKAIAQNNVEYLTRVSGIGKKTAEKMVFALKEKFKSQADENDEDMNYDADTIEALKALGYSARLAQETLKKVDGETTAEKVKIALKILNEKK